jgi:tight adherence protein C
VVGIHQPRQNLKGKSVLVIGVTLGWLLGLLVAASLLRHFLAQRLVQRRLFESSPEISQAVLSAGSRGGSLGRWMSLAGYRRAGAVPGFFALTVLSLAVGASIGYASWVLGVLAAADGAISVIPGGISDLMRPVLYMMPWLLTAAFAGIPLLIVRRARRRRVAQVERDLPVTLELLATLAEAGLGFDAALDRILTSQPSHRVLVQEFRTFQAEVLAGRPRVDCLRRITRRLDVTAVTILISALVQAEQIGSGVAEVLRSQADDLRQRRRERAIEFSMALPVKLLFPLVICFLPGILLFTLGPAFYEFFRLADTYSLHRRL